MGTRSTTTIFTQEYKPLLTMYRHMDGYVSVHGKELATFLANRKIVNGYGCGTEANVSNGMGCLAASMIAHFKTEIGGIYVVNAGDFELYNYNILLQKGELVISVSRNGLEIFRGTPEQLLEFKEEDD
jgi:hypothetical protein